MKPLSAHWADQTAARIVNVYGDKDSYTVASGITPSGKVHIGNFREVITVDMVYRSLKKLGKKVRFVYSWDNFDTFRKVPGNLPNQDMLEENLRRPICRVPDPNEKYGNYAEFNIKSFESELEQMGIFPEYLYQEKRYSEGMYAKEIRHALENKEKIRAILNEHRSSPLPDEWEPTSIYCEKCDRDQMDHHKYDGEWQYSYKCSSCGNEATTDLRTTKNIKLDWRTDWPMRWAFEGVDFEPGGKDHSSQGGSYDTAKNIVSEVWDKKPPQYLQYDFVMIKGDGAKMASSKGNVISISEALEVYSPQIIRWIFAGNRPNHDFYISFDSDAIKIYDEFDKNEILSLEGSAETSGKKWPSLRRAYELSLVGELPTKTPVRPSFRELCNRLQICDKNIQRTFDKFYSSEITESSDREYFKERAGRALNWLEKHADDRFIYNVNKSKIDFPMDEIMENSLKGLVKLIDETDLDQIDGKDLNQKIYDDIIRGVGCDSKEFFKVVYQKLISRDQGPRLPSFLKELGKEKLLNLLQ